MTDFNWPRVSPDGRHMAVVAQDSTGTNRVFLRQMDQTVWRPVLGAEGMSRFYWSPDSREIAFVAGEKILRLPITGGTPTVVCAARGGSDLSWSSAGFILMDGRYTDSLMVVPARGGELRPATRIYREDGEIGSGWPCFLPDGKHFLFIGNRSNSAGSESDIRLGQIGSLDSRLLGKSDGRVEYAPGDWVLYLKGATLLAQKLDVKAAALTGEPLTLVENIRVGSAAGHFSVSKAGLMAYGLADELAALTMFETDRAGKPVGPMVTRGLIVNPQIAPGGSRLLFEKKDSQTSDAQIVVRDLRRGTETKLTLNGSEARMPVWSPDGRRFACVMVEGQSKYSVLVSSSDGLGGRNSIPVPAGGGWMLTQWSPALNRLIMTPPSFVSTYQVDPDSAGAAPRALAGMEILSAQCAISPDGRWAAYVSNEGGGAPQVYVQSLTGTPGRWQISTTNGFWPKWTRNGKEIVYESQTDIMAVSINTSEGFHPGTPVALFAVPVHGSVDRLYWTPTDDGNHFFVLQSPRTGSQGTIEVVTDFASLVNRR